MARKKIELSDMFPYHLMNRSNNPKGFPLPLRECWTVFSDFLYLMEIQYGFKVHLFVLMKNHYHLLASTPRANLSTIMMRFQTEVAQAINDIGKSKNHVFSGQYKPCIIKDPHYYSTVFKYVLRNPVKAKYCDRVEHYKFSSLYGLLGQAHLMHPICPNPWDDFLPDRVLEILPWANTPFHKEQSSLISKSLCRKELKFSAQIMRQNKINFHTY